MLEASKQLYIAASEGPLAHAKTALANGAEVGYTGLSAGEGWTPLHIATVHHPRDHPEIIRLLLANRADPDSKDSRGRTPLLLASIYGLAEAVKDMAKVSRKHDAADLQGFNTLNHAALAGHHGVMHELLAARVDPSTVHPITKQEVRDVTTRRLLGIHHEDGAPAAAGTAQRATTAPGGANAGTSATAQPGAAAMSAGEL